MHFEESKTFKGNFDDISTVKSKSPKIIEQKERKESINILSNPSKPILILKKTPEPSEINSQNLFRTKILDDEEEMHIASKQIKFELFI